LEVIQGASKYIGRENFTFRTDKGRETPEKASISEKMRAEKMSTEKKHNWNIKQTAGQYARFNINYVCIDCGCNKIDLQNKRGRYYLTIDGRKHNYAPPCIPPIKSEIQ
jgi:hypothetical protein